MITNPCATCRYSIVCSTEERGKAGMNGECCRYDQRDDGHLQEAGGT